MSRFKAFLAIGLGLAGLLLPAHSMAVWLAGPDSPHLALVVTGIWVFKLMLVVHAGLVVAAAHWSLGKPGAGLVAALPAVEPVNRYEGAMVGGLLLVGALLRLYQLPNGLWFDEIQTLVDYVRLPLGQILTTYDSQNQHLLYSLSAGILHTLFGESALTLRFPAAVFGVASLYAVYRFGRLVAGRREALLALALLAFSYHHVWFSQNARGYTGLLFFTLAGTECFVRLLTGQTRRPWLTAVLYGAAMALAAYTHITAVLIVAAHALVWLWCYLRRGPDAGLTLAPLAGLVLATTFTLQLYAPVLPQVFGTVLHPPRGAAATAWQSPLWFATEALRGLSRGLPGGWVTLGAALVVVVAGLVSYWKRNAALTLLMVLPALVSGAALLALQHNLWPRFFFFSAGFAVLIALRGGFALAGLVLPPRLSFLATAGAVLLIVGSALTVPRAWHPKQDFVAASAFVERSGGPGDAVVTVDLTRYPYAEFYHKDYIPVGSLEALEAVEASHRRTWVLYTFPIRLAVVQPEIWSRLQADYRMAASFPGTVGGGAIVVMVRRFPHEQSEDAS